MLISFKPAESISPAVSSLFWGQKRAFRGSKCEQLFENRG